MRSALFAMLVFFAVPAVSAAQRVHIDLNGTWDFRLDPQDQGEAQAWHSSGVAFTRTIAVPGAWQAQGVGEAKGALRHDYAGVAWYRRTVAVSETWRGKSVWLRIGGAHRSTTLYVNGRKIGEHRGFSAPFTFDVTGVVRPGQDNVIALRIANPGAIPLEGPREQKPLQPTGMLNYLGNWGGIYGNVELEATDPTRIELVYVRPDVERKLARFVLTVQNRETKAYSGQVTVAVGPRYQGRTSVQVEPGGRTEVEVVVAMPDARLWSPADPHLYSATITVGQGRHERDRVEERFGMRQVQTRGNVLLLNGKPLYLRGYGDDNIEVLTGFPPSSRSVYVERLRRARAFGFNAVRFHSMTPSEEFFHAADEVGMFVMAELPAAYTQYVLPHRAFLRQELEDIVMAYRNRPSLLSVAFGNEFNLSWLETDTERQSFLETVDGFYRLAKSLHPDGLILSNDGYIMRPTDLVSHFGGGLPDLPVVKHEFGEYYCSLPDISLVDKFTGVLVPEWLHVKRKWVNEHGLSDQVRSVRPQLAAPPATWQEVSDRARAAPSGRDRLSLLAHRRLSWWNGRGRLVGGGMVRLLLAAQEHHAARRTGHQRRRPATRRHERQGPHSLERRSTHRGHHRVELWRHGSRRGPAEVGADVWREGSCIRHGARHRGDG